MATELALSYRNRISLNPNLIAAYDHVRINRASTEQHLTKDIKEPSLYIQ